MKNICTFFSLVLAAGLMASVPAFAARDGFSRSDLVVERLERMQAKANKAKAVEAEKKENKEHNCEDQNVCEQQMAKCCDNEDLHQQKCGS